MFIDEMFEEFLVNRKLKLAESFRLVCVEKLDKTDKNFESVKRIENGYQLFRKKHPEYPEHSFRTYVNLLSPQLASCLGWNKH